MARRYSYDLSRYHLTSMSTDFLYPVSVREVVPGDLTRMSGHAFIRCTPMVNPVMHPLHCTIHHWFVPNRILNSGWKYFISEDAKANPHIGTGWENTGQDFNLTHPGGDSQPHYKWDAPQTYFGQPMIKFETDAFFQNGKHRVEAKDDAEVAWYEDFKPGSLADRMGLKIRGLSSGAVRAAKLKDVLINAFPFLAYRLIWNEFYRDPDIDVMLASPYYWPYEYEAQKLIRNPQYKDFFQLKKVSTPKDYFTSARPFSQSASSLSVDIDVSGLTTNTQTNTVDGQANFDILDLRKTASLQRFFEHRLRQGYDYTRYLSSCGVNIHNDFCERPVYLGGSKSTIQFSDVVQTVGTDNAPLGALGGYGTGSHKGRRIKHFAKEHGFIMSLMSFVSVNLYADYIDKMWFRHSRFDYYTKELENIGMAPIDRRELGLFTNLGALTGTFGYKDMYEEYRTTFNQVSAEFGSMTKNGQYEGHGNGKYWNWTMAKTFWGTPALNASFIQSTTRKSPFVDKTSDIFQVMYYEDFKQKRRVIPRPKYQVI